MHIYVYIHVNISYTRTLSNGHVHLQSLKIARGVCVCGKTYIDILRDWHKKGHI